MATISNTPRPGYAWDATDNCWYPIGVGGHSHNEIPVTTVDAKGDLIVGTGADAVSRKSVGADGSVLVADSTQATGVNWAGTMQYAGKNKIINGDFKINQRNFTGTSGANAFYPVDRWMTTISGSMTFSLQTFTPGAAPVSGYEGTTFFQMATVGGTGSYGLLGQKIEDVRTFAGQTVTISFWAKATSGTPKIGVDMTQLFGSGGSSQASTPYSTFTLSTSWARYSTTVAVPSISGKTIGTNSSVLLDFTFTNDYNPVIGQQTATFQLWGVQVEAGSVATPFVPAGGGSPQAELALCQRYYYRRTGNGGPLTFGMAPNSTTVAQTYFQHIVPMRIPPTAIEVSGVGCSDEQSAFTTGTTTWDGSDNYATYVRYTHGSAALTAYRPYKLYLTGTNSYIAVSAEL